MNESETRSQADFIETCKDLLSRASDLPSRADDFADGISERIRGMQAWVNEHDHVTPAMWTAVGNIEAGIARWEDRG